MLVKSRQVIKVGNLCCFQPMVMARKSVVPCKKAIRLQHCWLAIKFYLSQSTQISVARAVSTWQAHKYYEKLYFVQMLMFIMLCLHKLVCMDYCKMHACTIIFCNVKTEVYDPYLGVCMRLLKEGGCGQQQLVIIFIIFAAIKGFVYKVINIICGHIHYNFLQFNQTYIYTG